MAEEKKDERVYVIPLSSVKGLSSTRRASAAVKRVKEAVLKNSKASKVRIDGKVNDLFWSKGIAKPPKNVKVKVTVEEDTAVVSLVE